jgi:hypothetical protein
MMLSLESIPSRLWLVELSSSHLLPLRDHHQKGRFWLNFQADYGCPALKEPFLSLERPLLRKAFLALNC